MESPEEAMGSNNNTDYAQSIMKGKRTKRPRPPAVASTSSTTSSAEFSGNATEEEEDMANCLILLAQGPKLESRTTEESGGGGGTEKFTSRRFTEAATTTNGKAGFYVYECKTCNKCFPSFQALGGHRASHKKPKMMNLQAGALMEEKKAVVFEEDHNLRISMMNSFSKPIIDNNNNKSRVHECSVCGSEFSSGQALGGHMRRHRPASVVEVQEVKKERNILSLDLNLPAPSEDDHRGGEFPKSPSSAFTFSSNKPLVFSVSALVDCHY